MTFWEYADHHPGYALTMVIVTAITITEIFQHCDRAWKRYLRARNIAAHGWPQPPVDADGDLVYPDADNPD
jgi:hypothetical protein